MLRMLKSRWLEYGRVPQSEASKWDKKDKHLTLKNINKNESIRTKLLPTLKLRKLKSR